MQLNHKIERMIVAVSTKAFAILLTCAVLFQSLLGGLWGAGPVCFGGGHDHAGERADQSCELGCSHDALPASSTFSLPAPVDETHNDCGCVDIDLSMPELLSTMSRLDPASESSVSLLSIDPVLASLADRGYESCSAPVPPWFDPGGTQRIVDLATTRLIL